MAKRTLLDILENTIGKYVKNLDAESLNVAVWSGKIELNGLELDIDAVNDELDRQAAEQPNFAIPLRVIGGTFERLEVDVPWSQLTSRAVVLRARGLAISVEPHDRLSKADFLQAVVESESKRIEQIQKARSRSIETRNDRRLRNKAVAKLAQVEEEDGDTIHQATTSSFGSRLVRRILENIEIEINDVHVSLKGQESTAGVVLGSLSLVTTDFRGCRTFVDRTSGPQDLANSFLHKMLKITGLGVYMDENNNSMGFEKRYKRTKSFQPQGVAEENEDEHECEEIESLQRDSRQLQEHSYILSPLSFQARLRQADNSICIDYPKYRLTSELSSLAILLSKRQLESFHCITRAIQAGDGARPLFPEYRPLCRVTKETAREWWWYAVRCIGRMNGRRLWPEFFMAYQKRKKYITLYKRSVYHGSCHWLDELDEQEQNDLEAIEQTRSISLEGIMAWRNIADGQFEKEQKKYDQHEESQRLRSQGSSSTSLGIKSYILSSLYAPVTENPRDDLSPITLTIDEMRELEYHSLIQAKDSDLSDDSKLYDLEFVLGSFTIDLTSHNMQRLALLEMGKVETTLNATADGAFLFHLELFSMQILDMFTPNSLFPAILSRAPPILLHSEFDDDVYADSEDHVFHLSLAKTKSGDQKVAVKLAEFQAIVSPLLFVELQRFFTVSEAHFPNTSSSEQPSIYGADVFWDAKEDATPKSPDTSNTSAMVTELSNKLADAWKTKTQEKTSLVLDLDVDAPQLIIPDNCVDPGANLLIFDLGHFRFHYGKEKVPKIQSWFQDNPRQDEANGGLVDPPSLDNGKLDITNLTFMVEKAGNWSRLTKTEHRSSAFAVAKNAAVVEPISISLDFGIENNQSNQAAENDNDKHSTSSVRVCAFGIIPTVALSVSPLQASEIYAVFMTWSRLLDEIFPPAASSSTPDVSVQPSHRHSTYSSPNRLSVLASSRHSTMTPSKDRFMTTGTNLLPSDRNTPGTSLSRRCSDFVTTSTSRAFNDNVFTIMHFAMNLQKLSLTVFTDAGSIDANIVSVDVTVSNGSDGSIRSKLRMGWFWILDRFQYHNFPRKQRLFAYSSLPTSPGEFAFEDNYDILEKLDGKGFCQDGHQSSELADISFTQFGSEGTKGGAPIHELLGFESLVAGEEKIGQILCARFSSLYIDLNPRAIKTLSNLYSNFLRMFKVSDGLNDEKLSMISRNTWFNDSTGLDFDNDNSQSDTGTLLVQFEMQTFELSLDSARDDLPLFKVTMTNAAIKALTSEMDDEEENDLMMSLDLGNLTIKTTDMGQTQLEYRTMVGLAPGLSKSLLSVKYYSGPRTMTLEDSGLLTNETTSYMSVQFSPMRIVYIQAQVFAFIEYINEGIMGSALAAMATSSAAVAAASAAGGSLVQVRATGFDFVLPQSAYTPKHFCIHAGELEVKYTFLPETGGAKTQLSLSRVQFQDSENVMMQDDPIRMLIDVSLPPLDVGTVEDQARRAVISISNASFRLSKPQYEQLMLTLEENMGEIDLFLRDNDEDAIDQPITNSRQGSNKSLTHAGVVAIDNPRRMYIEVNICILSLEICNKTIADPIARIAAVEAKIDYQSLPDELKSCKHITLGNVLCDDRRQKAIERQYQTLITQDTTCSASPSASDTATCDSAADGADGSKKIFRVSYESFDNGSSQIDLRIGSTRLVLIPDAISEILDFLHGEEKEEHFTKQITEALTEDGGDDVSSEGIEEGSDVTETSSRKSLSSALDSSGRVATMCLNARTSRSSVVFVDLGGHGHFAQENDQVLESIILEGACNMNLEYKFEQTSGDMKHAELEMFGEELEIYTAFGLERGSPVQILEPAGYSIVLSIAVDDDNSQKIDIRAAALSPVHFSFSMGNAALVTAIISGLTECVKEDSLELIVDEDIVPLSDQEAIRIKNLDSMLDRQESSATPISLSRRESFASVTSRTDSASGRDLTAELISSVFSMNVTIPEFKVTIINDLQGIDEALFRITVENFVSGGQVTKGLQSELTLFKFYLHTSLLADYYDASADLWKILLKEPWEVTVVSQRKKSLAKLRSHRFDTSVCVESLPCNISFSEQFLVSLAAASRMWSIYSMASSSAIAEVEKERIYQGLQEEKKYAAKSAAASAARNWIATLPYALDNRAGVHATFSCPGNNNRECANGSIQYFRFQPPRVQGFGGKRLYGQEILGTKFLRIVINEDENTVIQIDDVNAELGRPRRAHELKNGCMLMTWVEKEGKTIVIHLSSSIEVQNKTSFPLAFGLLEGRKKKWLDVGVCKVRSAVSSTKKLVDQRRLVLLKGFEKSSQNFSIPADSLNGFVNNWNSQGQAMISLGVSVQCPDCYSGQPTELRGEIRIEPIHEVLQSAGGTCTSYCDVACRPPLGAYLCSFVLQTTVKMFLHNNKYLFVSIHLEPRAKVINKMPVTLNVRTPMPHTYSTTAKESEDSEEVVHVLKTDCSMEIFTPGPSMRVAMQCADKPVCGNSTGWTGHEWIHLPLISESRLRRPLTCIFPYFKQAGKSSDHVGCEFFIAQGTHMLSSLGYSEEENQNLDAVDPVSVASTSKDPLNVEEPSRLFFVAVCRYAIDHTGSVLFEQSTKVDKKKSERKVVLGAFASWGQKRRITLLPSSNKTPMRLLKTSMNFGDETMRSVSFCVDDVAKCKGGVESTPIQWEGEPCSEYFAYEKLVNQYQSEIHIIPEFVVFNGSDIYDLVVRQPGATDVTVGTGEIAPIWIVSAERGLILWMEYNAINCRTGPVRVDSLGPRVAMVKSMMEGNPMGSVVIQTAIGGEDSRLVIKVGEVNLGSSRKNTEMEQEPKSLYSFQDDFLSFRLKSSGVWLTMSEAQKNYTEKQDTNQEFCTVILKRFSVEWQRTFKDEMSGDLSERSHLFVRMHSFQILDNTPDTPYPVVFDATSERFRFVDFCARFRGSLYGDLVEVDLFDLTLKHGKGHTESIALSTSENFVWKILDLAGRIGEASAFDAGDELVLEWDEQHGGYLATTGNKLISQNEETIYTPPKIDKLYNIKRATISPFALVFSFHRNPERDRYQKLSGTYGTGIMNYVTRHLKFKIDKAELKFPRYETRKIKGPLDRLFEEITAVYYSLTKRKIITIMTASRFYDWKSLASRDHGGDEFVDGDLFRFTGNLAGQTLSYVTGSMGHGLSKGVTAVSHKVGDTIEDATGKVGARVVGAGINSVVSGVGHGVGDTLTGVGVGAGKVLSGAGKGIGQVAGGVAGGVSIVAKGVKKGVVKGDAKAVVSGVTEGANAIGTGIGKGVGTAAVGAKDGALTVGKGFVSGVQNVGKGIGGAFTPQRKNQREYGISKSNSFPQDSQH